MTNNLTLSNGKSRFHLDESAYGVYIEATKNQTAYERKRLLAKRRKYFKQ